MDAAEGMKASIAELKKTEAEKIARVKAAVIALQQGRHTQTETPRRLTAPTP